MIKMLPFSRNVKSLEKVCQDLIRGAKDKQFWPILVLKTVQG